MIVDFILNMVILVGIISLFNLMRYTLRIRKVIKDNKDNPNIQGISIVNGEIKVIERKPQSEVRAESVPKVIDEICHKPLRKEEAYRVYMNGEEHYFCSWECRETFIRKQQEGRS